MAGGVPGAVGAGDAVPLGEAPLIQDDTYVSITIFYLTAVLFYLNLYP